MNGSKTVDEKAPIKASISGTIFHSLRLVVDNRSLKSTKVFLDDRFIGSIQEHFAPRLKGGVLVLNKFEMSTVLKPTFVVLSGAPATGVVIWPRTTVRLSLWRRYMSKMHQSATQANAPR